MEALTTVPNDPVTAPWPVYPIEQPDAGPTAEQKIDEAVSKALAEDPGLSRVDAFGGTVSAGWTPGPTLYFEDHRAIELMPTESLQRYEYRSMGLAGTGDVFVLSRRRLPAFESYLREVVGLGAPRILAVAPDRGETRAPIATACATDEAAMRHLIEEARQQGSFNIMPYLATGFAWMLAGTLSARSGVRVHVCGPPPKLCQRVNDKLWFLRQVRRLLHAGAAPPAYWSFGLAAATARLSRLAHRHDRLVVKLPSSAGSMGNLVLSGARLREMSPQRLRSLLAASLREMGWSGRYPILIGVWDSAVLASPSVQMWLPAEAHGAAIIEAIFTQRLSLRQGTFVGASDEALPDGVGARLKRQAIVIARFLQKLGYAGRLSLDAVLTGDLLEDAEIHWVECNGRWGGVSIPLTVASRIGVQGRRPSIAVVQRAPAAISISGFDEAVSRLDNILYRRGEGGSGIVFLQPTGPGEGTNFFAMAEDSAAASALAEEAWARLAA